MSNKYSFSDSFDNISFSESGRVINKDYNTINISTTTGSISFDDSVYVNETFALSQVNLKRNSQKSSEDIFNNSSDFANFVSDSDSEVISSTSEYSSLIQPEREEEQIILEDLVENCDNTRIKNENIPKNIHDNDKNVKNVSQDSCRRKLSDWNLPEMILQKYENRNITDMFLWQCECLAKENVLENNKNLVYSAPTSAGKTLVSEILAIKTLLERNKKVIFILPFVSVVREKMFYFQDILSTSGIRVEGFMGSYSPPGGFQLVQLAICTIEKANSLINRLLQENNLSDLGAVIVDEMHLLGDPSRGYLLELLLTKLNYMTLKHENINIQIIGMSATLPNLDLLANWLNAELYTTNFRPIPLYEQCHVNGEIYDNTMTFMRKLPVINELGTDTDNILQLCLETIQNSCSILIFCPTKNWCENLAQQIALAIWKLGNTDSSFGECLRNQLNPNAISEVLEQLKRCPVGLDKILNKTISFGAAFHHAGLTMDERDIIEGAFRSNAIRILIATSTLSSGVNLPARRVIIRTPLFHGKPIDILTYKQMIGRAGRMGKDTAGESLLVCQKNDYKIAKDLMFAKLKPIESCLSGSGKLKRAILEVIASSVVSTPEDVLLFTACTLLANEGKDTLQNPIEEALNFLINNQFIRLQTLENGSKIYVASSLGKACLSSSLPPEEGLTLFTELEKARQCFVLETELHLVYLVTPYSACNQWSNIDWMFFLDLWEKLPVSMKRVGKLVGVSEAYIVNASRGKIQTNTNQNFHRLQVHKRFYTSLALQDLVNEVPLNDVAMKFNCSRGVLQSLQQSASTFAGMVTSFSKQLGWSSVEILISQFQDRLHFGVNRDLLDLMRLPILNGPRARALYNSGIENLIQLASARPDFIENVLHKVIPFESEKEREGESKYDADQRNKIRSVWITGKQGLTEKEAAQMLIADAREYLQLEMGLVDAKWDNTANNSRNITLNEIEKDAKNASNNNLNENSSFTEKNISEKMENENTDQNLDGSIKSSSIINKSDDSDIFGDSDLNESFGSKGGFYLNENEEKEGHKEQTTDADIGSILSTSIDVITNISEGNCSDNSLMKTNLPEEIQNKSIPSGNINLDANSTKLEEIQNKSIPNSNINVDANSTKLSTQLNWSNDSLFENSFEALEMSKKLESPKNTKPEPSTGTHQISNIASTSLENAFNTDFSIKVDETTNTTPAVNKSVESGTPINTSSECILSSQAETELLNTPLKRFNASRRMSVNKKRNRSIDDIITNSNSDNSCLGETPLKRKKLNTKIKSSKKYRSAKSSKTIDDTFIISQNFQTTDVSYKSSQKISANLTKIEIVDVSENYELFDCFRKEIKEKQEISLSLGCTKLEIIKPKIGGKKLSPQTKNSELSHENVKVDGISITWGDNTAYYIDFNSKIIDLKYKLSLLENILNNSNLKIIIFDCKEQIRILKLCLQIDTNTTIEDPKVADWLLDPDGKEKNLQAMALKYAPEAVKLSQLAGNSKGVGSVGLDLNSAIKPRLRSAVEALSTWYIVPSVLDVIAQQEMRLLHTYYIEMECILVLSKMELSGICVNKFELQKLTEMLNDQSAAIQKKAYNLAGRQFSFTSPTEVAKVLGMYKGKRVSTSKQVLEQNDDPIASLIINWRKLNCTLTKMVYPFHKMIQNERIYGSFITFSATGRISMHEPNLQNVPRNFEILNPLNNETILINCRDVFKTTDGFVLISADYCQLELRLLAHLSKDDVLCKIMRSKKDVFKSIAAKLNTIQETEVTDQLRQRAKQICYGIIYGMGLKSLADQLDSSEEDASTFLAEFHKKYPLINEYVKATIKECKEEGYVETIASRRRYLPNIKHQHSPTKCQAERQAVNTTIQGSAADIAKNAMVLIQKHIGEKFKRSKNKPQLILQLHDEFLYEVPEKYAGAMSRLIKNCMENSVKLDVPFPVKVRQGKSWGNLKEITF